MSVVWPQDGCCTQAAAGYLSGCQVKARGHRSSFPSPSTSHRYSRCLGGCPPTLPRARKLGQHGPRQGERRTRSGEKLLSRHFQTAIFLLIAVRRLVWPRTRRVHVGGGAHQRKSVSPGGGSDTRLTGAPRARTELTCALVKPSEKISVILLILSYMK